MADFPANCSALARPAIVAGVSLAIMETIADYGTVSHFGVQTLTTGIYRAFYSLAIGRRRPVGDDLARLRSGLSRLERMTRGRKLSNRAASTSGSLLSADRSTHGLAWLACAVPITLGFLLPAGLMVSMAIEAGNLFEDRTLELVQNSVILSAIAAFFGF